MAFLGDYYACWQEVRKRLYVCLMVWACLFSVCFYFRYDLLVWSRSSLMTQAQSLPPVVSLSILDGFYVSFEVAYYLSLLLSLPVFICQIWCFLVPALHASERLLLRIILFMGGGLFLMGLFLGWFVMMPMIFSYAHFFMPKDVVWMIDLRHYVSLFWCAGLYGGLFLEVPLVIFLLLHFGFVDTMAIRQCRPYVFLGCFIIGMLVTPPDMFAQVFFALPLYALFETGYLLSLFIHRFIACGKEIVLRSS